jgi:DNA-nicking Smr family endonuclease
MEQWLLMYPPTGKKPEASLAPSRYQKVNNLKAQRELDLHGMSWQEASIALNRFIQKAMEDGVTAVRIIHGKGKRSQVKGGVLRHKVNEYLQQDKRIKKVSQAGYRDGQSGACMAVIKLQAQD